MLIANVIGGKKPAPVIVVTSSVINQINGQPFTFNLDLSTFSKNCLVICVAAGDNANMNSNIVTLDGNAPTGSVLSEDNDSSDRALFNIYWWLTTSIATSVPLSIGLVSGIPDSWRIMFFALLGVNESTPIVVTAHSETNSIALKTINLDTSAYNGNTLVIGGRCHARSALITCTAGAGITEVTDGGSNSQSLWIGKVADMTPQSLAFECTGSATDDGDAMAAVAFRG